MKAVGDEAATREGHVPSSQPVPDGPLELDASWGRATRVWWAFAWRSLLAIPLGAAVGCVIGFIIGAVGGAIGLGSARIQLLVQAVTLPVGLVLGGLVGIWATYAVLRKQFQEFRIALLPRKSG